MSREKEIESIDRCIQELVYQKIALRKAYNYYHGVRDAEQFKYLEENYGIGTPTSITFTPLMKKHIDVLVGEYLELEPEMTVTCKDDDTISKIQRDKKLKVDSEIYKIQIITHLDIGIQVNLERKPVINTSFRLLPFVLIFHRKHDTKHTKCLSKKLASDIGIEKLDQKAQDNASQKCHRRKLTFGIQCIPETEYINDREYDISSRYQINDSLCPVSCKFALCVMIINK